MDRNYKFLIRQLRIFLVIIKRTLAFLRAASFLSVLFLFSCFAFLFINFVRDQILFTYSTSQYRLSSWICRSYMFLLCNGIIVILVFCSSSCPTATLDPEQKGLGFEIMLIPHQSEREMDCDREEPKLDYEHCFGYQDQVMGKKEMNMDENRTMYDYLKSENLITQFDDQSIQTAYLDEEETGAGTTTTEEDAGDGWCSLSRDELNKRCDDFIRKMKEEIKCEQRRLLLDFVR
ncbi:hypothetical protein Droror1_Dr00022925 [Drosera rotundifolia]